MGGQQVINLLILANNYLPLVQCEYEHLQNKNIALEFKLRVSADLFQNLNDQIIDMSKRIEAIRLEARFDVSLLSLSTDVKEVVADLDVLVIAVPSAYAEASLAESTTEMTGRVKGHLRDKRLTSPKKHPAQLLYAGTVQCSTGELFCCPWSLSCRRSRCGKIILSHFFRHR